MRISDAMTMASRVRLSRWPLWIKRPLLFGLLVLAGGICCRMPAWAADAETAEPETPAKEATARPSLEQRLKEAQMVYGKGMVVARPQRTIEDGWAELRQDLLLSAILVVAGGFAVRRFAPGVVAGIAARINPALLTETAGDFSLEDLAEEGAVSVFWLISALVRARLHRASQTMNVLPRPS
jgi:hypothetical protein